MDVDLNSDTIITNDQYIIHVDKEMMIDPLQAKSLAVDPTKT